jgi:hypothetical protein
VRKGYESRSSGHEAAFVDPWFDGHNYACTIVVTPNLGTCIAAAGKASDLGDDSLGLLVQQELELSVFASDFTIQDLAASASACPQARHTLPVTEALKALSPPPRSCYRYACVELEDHVKTLEPSMALQIGRVLWRVLDPDGSEGLPDEESPGHLVVDAESVSVWSRRGVVVAVRSRSQTLADELGWSFEALAGLARDVEALLESPEDRVTRGEKLIRQIASLRHELALPQVRPLRSFFECSGLSELLGQVHQLNSAQMEHEQAKRTGENIKTVADVQKTVHWIETFVVSVYAVELFHVLGVSFGFRHEYIAWGVVFAAAFTVVSIALVLHPWRHGGVSRGMIGFLIAMALIIAGFVALGKSKYTSDEQSHNSGGGAATPHDGSGAILPTPP